MISHQKALGYFLVFINIAILELVESHLGSDLMTAHIYVFMCINWAKIVLYLIGQAVVIL